MSCFWKGENYRVPIVSSEDKHVWFEDFVSLNRVLLHCRLQKLWMKGHLFCQFYWTIDYLSFAPFFIFLLDSLFFHLLNINFNEQFGTYSRTTVLSFDCCLLSVGDFGESFLVNIVSEESSEIFNCWQRKRDSNERQ